MIQSAHTYTFPPYFMLFQIKLSVGRRCRSPSNTASATSDQSLHYLPRSFMGPKAYMSYDHLASHLLLAYFSVCRAWHQNHRAIHSIFKIIDNCIEFYSQNTNLLPPKPKSSFRHLKQGIQEFHRKHVLVPAHKAANNVIVV